MIRILKKKKLNGENISSAIDRFFYFFYFVDGKMDGTCIREKGEYYLLLVIYFKEKTMWVISLTIYIYTYITEK